MSPKSKRNRQCLLRPSRSAAGVMLLLALVSSGCTITGAQREATKDLHWLGFKSHSDLNADTRWQFAPDTRILISESSPAAQRDWLGSAEEGFYSVFQPPDAGFDLILLINWPAERRASPDAKSGWRLLPKTTDPVDVTLKLISAFDDRVVQTAQLRVDPSWFSAQRRRPGQIEESFRRYAESLAARR